MNMHIQHSENENGGLFYIEQNEAHLAELVYRKEHGRIVIEHTEVDETLRGHNIGYTLVERAVELAREQKLSVVPLCRFASKIMHGHKEFQDIL